MSDLTDEVCRLIERCGEDEKRILLRHLLQLIPRHPLEQEWGTTAEAILTAIDRSPDLTQRGIRGILAEAIFEEFVMPPLQEAGWHAAPIEGDQAFDFVLERAERSISVQVKLQRREKGVPKEYPTGRRSGLLLPPGDVYVVEVQKTRSGEKKGVATRPYRFGDFDILAVNLHPATGDWKRFMYTVGRWLMPRSSDPDLIEIFQPVVNVADDYWTDDIQQCIAWFLSGDQRRLYQK